MARLLTALALLLAVTVTLASLTSTAAARSVRLLGDGMTADGASGAAHTIGVITAEGSPSFARSSSGNDEQSRRKLGLIIDTIKWFNEKRNNAPCVCSKAEGLRAETLIQQPPTAAPRNTDGSGVKTESV
ncbi:unnamed protein product [Closterium sp. NIES-53]